MAKILKAENIQTDLLGSNGNNAFSLQRNSSSLLTLHTNDYVGVNTTSPSHLFEVRGSSFPKICITSDDQSIDTGATFRIDLKNASNSLFEAGTISVRHVASNQTAAAESSYMSFFTRNAGTVAERMRIGNTGSVGIGTTNPATRLHVGGGHIQIDDGYSLLFGGTANGILGSNASSYIRFTTNSAVRMVINNAGLVGIGTTNPVRDLTVDNATDPEIGLYTAGTERVKFSTGGSAQSVLAIDIGGVERLRIDSTGDVGIGVTPSAWSVSYVGLQIGGSTSIWTDKTAGLRTFISTNLFFDGTNRKYIATGASSEYLQGTDGSHVWYSAVSGSAGSNITFTERLRIDSSGNVGIGTTSPAAKLDVYGDGGFQFIEVGKSGLSGNRNALIDFIGDDTYTDYGFRIIRQNTGANASTVLQARGTGGLFLRTEEAGDIVLQTTNTERLRIDSSGGVTIAGLAGAGSRAVNASAAGLLSAASDASLKEEVVGASIAGLNEILQIHPKMYRWKDDIANRGENASVELGFIANDVAPIIPSAAPLGNDGLYGLYDRSITAALVKAVQELKAENDSLKSRIETLEAKL